MIITFIILKMEINFDYFQKIKFQEFFNQNFAYLKYQKDIINIFLIILFLKLEVTLEVGKKI